MIVKSYSKTTVESNIQQYSRGLHPVGALSVPPLVKINTQQGLPSVSQKKEKILRPQSTASSRPWSRGLHPVGALSVLPLVRSPSWHGLSSPSKKIPCSQTSADCPQSTVVSGTTPSGCTQRAPTGSKIPFDQTEWRS